MSWLGDLFGGSGSQSVQTVDAFEQLPPEFKDYLLAQAKAGKANVEDVAKARAVYMDPDRALAPMNGVEQAGLDLALGTSDAAAGLEDRGVDAYAGMTDNISGITGANPDQYVAQYEDPFLDDVVGTTLSRMDEDLARRSMMDESAAAALSGTTNTRRAVAQGVDRQLTEREKAAAEASMRSEGFNTARRLAFDRAAFDVDKFDRGATQFAAQGAGFGDAAARRSARGLAEGSYLQAFGEKARGIDQARIDAPRDALGWETALMGNVDMPQSRSVTTSNSGGNTWGQMAGGALAAYQVLSDERAKEGVAPIEGGAALDAVREMRPSTYNYRVGLGHTDAPTSGLMAQDLAGIPGAVAEGDDGYLRVDPYPVLATLAAAVQELDRRTI